MSNGWRIEMLSPGSGGLREKFLVHRGDSELNSIIGPGLAHQLAYIGLNGPLFNAQVGRDLAVRPRHRNQFQNLTLPRG